MRNLPVGYACAGLAVVLLLYAIWNASSGASGADVMMVTAALFALLAAVLTLRSRKTRL